jgi:ubiquinone/menaquinone biosynthesis C-methylase UbiE
LENWSAYYDKLFWTKDLSYLDTIIEKANFIKEDLVLDVGCGTGAVTKAIKPNVKHVIGIDISDAMLSKGEWEGTSLVKCDISEHVFCDNLFDKITARMVFHHILDNLDRVFIQCYDLLRDNGRLIVAEGVPPSDDDEIVDWFTEMFKLKEERRTFTSQEIAFYMKKNGFEDVEQVEYLMDDFSVKNWLENSGLEKDKQDKIMDMHVNASKNVKEVYQMRFTDDDCLIRIRNIITVGNKKREIC